MAVATFANALMELDSPSSVEDLASDLDQHEIELLKSALGEDVDAEGFLFADSANLVAINYVRDNQDALDGDSKRKFGDFVATRFTRIFNAVVESGCIAPILI